MDLDVRFPIKEVLTLHIFFINKIRIRNLVELLLKKFNTFLSIDIVRPRDLVGHLLRKLWFKLKT